MKNSTRKVYGRLKSARQSYHDNEKYWSALRAGRAAFDHRWSQFWNAAADLHTIAETEAAHRAICKFQGELADDSYKVYRRMGWLIIPENGGDTDD